MLSENIYQLCIYKDFNWQLLSKNWDFVSTTLKYQQSSLERQWQTADAIDEQSYEFSRAIFDIIVGMLIKHN